MKSKSLKSILITDDCDISLIEGLRDMGFNVDYSQSITPDDVDRIIGNYHGIVVNTKIKMDKHRIDCGKSLEFICRLGSGLDHIDLDYCKAKGIEVISSPEGNRQAVAEHALGMLLALMVKLRTGWAQVSKHLWNRESARGVELSGKTVGIIGFGNNGSAFADVLAGFDVDVLIYDKYKEVESGSFFRSRRIKSTLDELFLKANIISLHVPLTEETLGLINQKFIERCNDKTILINTSRGLVANLDAIIEGLQKGKLGGVCLDVFPNEKVDTFSQKEKEQINYLASLPNTILTPHVAGWTVESKIKISNILLGKVSQMLLSKR